MVTGLVLSWLNLLRSGIVCVEEYVVKRATVYVDKCVDVDGEDLLPWGFVEPIIPVLFYNIYLVDYPFNVRN